MLEALCTANNQYHGKVLLNIFCLNGHTVGFCRQTLNFNGHSQAQQWELPCRKSKEHRRTLLFNIFLWNGHTWGFPSRALIQVLLGRFPLDRRHFNNVELPGLMTYTLRHFEATAFLILVDGFSESFIWFLPGLRPVKGGSFEVIRYFSRFFVTIYSFGLVWLRVIEGKSELEA